jgi:ADP-heptose:LPS heptosyltransferase
VFSTQKIKAYLLKFFTRKKISNFQISNAKKILFLRYDRIGDMIITTPVFRELKRVYPQIEISVLASKSNQLVLKNNPYIKNVYLNHKNNFLSDLWTLFYLRKNNFDVCIEFDHSVIPHAIFRLIVIKPKLVISVEKKGRYGVKGSQLKLYDYYTQKESNSHFRDIWLETLSPFSVQPNSNNYDLFTTHSQNLLAKEFVNQFHNSFLIGINLEGAVKGKKINYEDLERISVSLYQKYKDIQIIILSTPNNFHNVKDHVKGMGLEYVTTSYKTKTILDVSALISHLDFIITPDTSIVHIASNYNKPIVSIHENNNDSYELFAPTSSLNRTIFSSSKKSLEGFSPDLLLIKCIELIDIVRVEVLIQD